MKNKLILILLLVISILCLVSCNEEKEDDLVETYTITWVNDDGTTLEIDYDVVKGTMPEYNGSAPVSSWESSAVNSYVFTGWSPEVLEVTKDAVYTATYMKLNISTTILGSKPIVSEDGKTVTYGLYPQSYVSDTNLIATLNTLDKEPNGWYLYEDNYYVKETASIYNNEDYKFNDGISIEDKKEYWFKCEPIVWNILSSEGEVYYLLSSVLLDAGSFNSNINTEVVDGMTVYSNNYEHSDIRSWLNEYFYNCAFSLNNTFIKSVQVNNDGATSDDINNKYASNKTTDKVYLPSYADYLNSSYGFASDSAAGSITRECKTTEYARCKGAWYNEDSQFKYNGSYWTRTATSQYYYCAWNVNSSGYLSTYAVNGNSHCVRPCITVYIPA